MNTPENGGKDKKPTNPRITPTERFLLRGVKKDRVEGDVIPSNALLISSVTRDEFLAGLNLGPQPSVVETPVEPEKLVRDMREDEWRRLFSYAPGASGELVDWLDEFVEKNSTHLDIASNGTAAMARLLRLEFGIEWLQNFAALNPGDVKNTARQRYLLPPTAESFQYLHYSNLQATALRLRHGIEIPPYENFLVEAIQGVARLNPGYFEYAVLDGAICLYDVTQHFRRTLKLRHRRLVV